MLDEQVVQSIYQEVRKEYAYPPVALLLRSGPSGHVASIANRRIYLDIDNVRDEIECRSLLRHEIGHTEYAPITIKNHRDFLAATLKEHALPIDIALDLHNVSYDLIVDFNARFKHNDDIGHVTGLDINDKKHKKKDECEISKYMIVFYAAIAGDSRMFGKYSKDIRDRAAKAIKICRTQMPLCEKVAELNRIIIDWYKQQDENRKKMLENLRQALQKAVKEMLENDGKFSTKEDTRGTKKESVMDLAGGTRGNKLLQAITTAIAARNNIVLQEIDFYRAYAKRNIRFAVKTGISLSPRVPAGFRTWTPDDNVSALNVEQGLALSGINIPGITTQQSLTLPGHGIYLPDGSNISLLLVVDTSGSMVQDETVLTAFSFIESARRNNYPVGIIFFHTRPYLIINPTREYEKTEEEIWKGYQSGGTTIIPALREAQKMGSKNLILVVSDFEGEGKEDVDVVLSELAINNTTRAIVLFDGNIPATIPSINVPDIEQLSSVVISEVDTFTTQEAR
ncbi:MAG: VWA domain-containing protein [Caldisericia bacterium]